VFIEISKREMASDSVLKTKPLTGQENFSRWKTIVSLYFQRVENAEELLNGELDEPILLDLEKATAAEKKKYKEELKTFKTVNSKVFVDLFNNMAEDVQDKVKRFTKAREVWLELERLYEGNDKERSLNFVFKFFTFEKGDMSISDAISKLQTI